MRKYGLDDFNTTILQTHDSVDEALLYEQAMIIKHNTHWTENGYNISWGGHKSPTLKGKDHPGYGKPRSEKTKALISKNHAPCSGQLNSNAKTYKLQSPSGDQFIITGGLKQFCAQHKLGYSTVNRQLLQNIKPTRGTFVNWEISQL